MEHEPQPEEDLPIRGAIHPVDFEAQVDQAITQAWQEGRHIDDLTAKRIALELDPGSGPLHELAETGVIAPDIGPELAAAAEVVRDMEWNERIPWVAALRQYVGGRIVVSELPGWSDLGRERGSSHSGADEAVQEAREGAGEQPLVIEFGSLDLIPPGPDGVSWAEWVIGRGIEQAMQEDRPIDHRTAHYIAD